MLMTLLPEILLAAAGVLGGAVAFMPNVSSRNRMVLIATAALALVVTAFSYHLVSQTGRGLFERAACVVLPDGDYCQAAIPVTADAVIGDWEGDGAIGAGASFAQRMTLHRDGTVFVPTPGFSGEWSIVRNELHVRIVCNGVPACNNGGAMLFSGPVVGGDYEATGQTENNRIVRLTMRRVVEPQATPADYME